jgi:hypothetical protein
MSQEIMRLRGELDAATVCLSVLCEGMASLHGKTPGEAGLQLMQQTRVKPQVREQMGPAWSEGFERFNKRLATYIRLPG